MEREARPARLAGHLPGLDGVRGLAILMVMAVHFVGGLRAQTFAQRAVVKIANMGALGVDLFFVLSGFLITGLLIDAKGKPRYFRNFYARRTLRIFPLYFGTLAVLFLVLPAFVRLPAGLEIARTHQIWLWTYTSNFYVASKGTWSSLSYVTHFWSLAIEEHFYLLWPVCVFCFGSSALERVCVGVLAAGLALRIAAALCGVSELAIQVLTPCRVDTLCLGGLLALLARRPGGLDALLRKVVPALSILAAVIFVLSSWCALVKSGLPVLHQVRNTLYAAFFGALCIWSLKPRSIGSTIFTSSILRFFGKYSYGLYVYHGLLTWYLDDQHLEARLDAAFGAHWLTMACSAVIGVGLSLPVALASYHLFEKRFLALKRAFETRAAPRGDASPVLAPAETQR